MQEDACAVRLSQIAQSLSNLYTIIGEIERREVTSRAELFKSAYLEGEGVTAAKELARHQVANDVADKGQKQADVSGLIEERDMLRFAAERGWLEFI